MSIPIWIKVGMDNRIDRTFPTNLPQDLTGHALVINASDQINGAVSYEDKGTYQDTTSFLS